MTTVSKRLEGCPTGATRAALLANGHTNEEINDAVDAGFVTRIVRDYAKPRGFKLEWFYVGDLT
jgi:hypothetical protein